MSRGNTERNSLNRAIRILAWATALLDVTVVLHGIAYTLNTRRAIERERRAYDAGRAKSVALDFDDFETRLNRR